MKWATPGVPAFSLGDSDQATAQGGHPEPMGVWNRKARSGRGRPRSGVREEWQRRDGCVRQRQRSAVASSLRAVRSLPMRKAPRRLERSLKASRVILQSSHGQEAVHASATQNLERKTLKYMMFWAQFSEDYCLSSGAKLALS